MLKEEIVFVDLSREETKQLLSGDNIIREYRLANIDFIIVQIPLVLLLVDLFYHGQGDAVFFSDPVRLLTITDKICVGMLLAVKVTKLVDGLREGDSAAFLLQ